MLIVSLSDPSAKELSFSPDCVVGERARLEMEKCCEYEIKKIIQQPIRSSPLTPAHSSSDRITSSFISFDKRNFQIII